MKHYFDGLLALLRKRKHAGVFLVLSIVYTFMLTGMRVLVWLGLDEFPPAAFQGMFLIVIACLLFTWVLSRIDFGDRR